MRVAINGFGRIGRTAARILLQRDELELVAINDPSQTELTAHLFAYDTSYGKYPGTVEVGENGESLIIDGKVIQKFTTRNITDLPWADLNIDVVLECTGVFRTIDAVTPHIDQGAKKVLLSAPAKSEGFTTVVLGVNDEVLTGNEIFVSNASCTTNCLAPVAKVLNDTFGIESGLMTTIHSYTNDQRILDVGHKDFRRARAAAMNIIPTTTGAAKAVSIVIPELAGKLNGMSIRVPSPTVSLVDLVAELKTPATAEEVNAVLKKAAAENPKILGYSELPLVSTDYKGDTRSSIVDGLQTMVSGKQVKVLSWYDNEWGYTERLIDIAEQMCGLE